MDATPVTSCDLLAEKEPDRSVMADLSSVRGMLGLIPWQPPTIQKRAGSMPLYLLTVPCAMTTPRLTFPNDGGPELKLF